MKKIDYRELGATLFTPATYKDLETLVSGKKYPQLRSLVIDTEDGINENDYPQAIHNIATLLSNIESIKPYLFLRPRNLNSLEEMLTQEGVKKLTGFVLPKFSLQNAEVYLSHLENTDFHFMPSIEGAELFNTNELRELKDILLPYKERIPLIRFGAEDMLRQLGLRRRCDESLFDFAAIQSPLGNFIATFKSSGFAVSGGVYPCYNDTQGFVADVKRDLHEGLFSKTIIHPNQIALIEEIYRVTQEELDEAKEIEKSRDSIFTQNGKMAEPVTMLAYSQGIIARADIYGIR